MKKSRRDVSARILLFRLNTIEISLPPLRERREDIMPLANSFLRQHGTRYRKELTGFEEAARDLLMKHQFPGNVRELRSRDRARRPDDARSAGEIERSWPNEWHGSDASIEDMSLEEVEAFLIKKALGRFDGNARRAAEALGLSRSAFYRRLQHYGLVNACDCGG